MTFTWQQLQVVGISLISCMAVFLLFHLTFKLGLRLGIMMVYDKLVQLKIENASFYIHGEPLLGIERGVHRLAHDRDAQREHNESLRKQLHDIRQTEKQLQAKYQSLLEENQSLRQELERVYKRLQSAASFHEETCGSLRHIKDAYHDLGLQLGVLEDILHSQDDRPADAEDTEKAV